MIRDAGRTGGSGWWVLAWALWAVGSLAACAGGTRIVPASHGVGGVLVAADLRPGDILVAGQRRARLPEAFVREQERLEGVAREHRVGVRGLSATEPVLADGLTRAGVREAWVVGDGSTRLGVDWGAFAGASLPADYAAHYALVAKGDPRYAIVTQVERLDGSRLEVRGEDMGRAIGARLANEVPGGGEPARAIVSRPGAPLLVATRVVHASSPDARDLPMPSSPGSTRSATGAGSLVRGDGRAIVVASPTRLGALLAREPDLRLTDAPEDPSQFLSWLARRPALEVRSELIVEPGAGAVAASEIVLGPGGVVRCAGAATIVALNLKSNGGRFESSAGAGRAGEAGRAGADGASFPRDPRTNGAPTIHGGEGRAGGRGADGQSGADAPALTILAVRVTGELRGSLAGGRGGTGGDGGRGGGGGQGAGASSGIDTLYECKSSGQPGGDGGRGGDGGDGGDAGSGGRGGSVQIVSVNPCEPGSWTLAGGPSGSVGAGGEPGQGGSGGDGAPRIGWCNAQPSGRPGQAGRHGSPGREGAAGAEGQARLEILQASGAPDWNAFVARVRGAARTG